MYFRRGHITNIECVDQADVRVPLERLFGTATTIWLADSRCYRFVLIVYSVLAWAAKCHSRKQPVHSFCHALPGGQFEVQKLLKSASDAEPVWQLSWDYRRPTLLRLIVCNRPGAKT